MEVQDDNDLPHITRNLVQIQHMGERLCPSRGSGIEVKAARLFGPKMSYELPQKLSSKLETLVPANVYETVPRIPESDIQSFLKSERENALFSALLMTRKSVSHSLCHNQLVLYFQFCVIFISLPQLMKSVS
uniref:Uncharacterized protein n=1 Tax=Trichobilharzia regenti TaxID=157069 RepID=A0AA85J8W1_TRIRE|nr:unnamed protein product [Trichobilharzia regenti]